MLDTVQEKVLAIKKGNKAVCGKCQSVEIHPLSAKVCECGAIPLWTFAILKFAERNKAMPLLDLCEDFASQGPWTSEEVAELMLGDFMDSEV